EDALSLSLWLQPAASVAEIQTVAALGELELEWALTLMEGRLAFFLGGNDSPENPDFLSPTAIYDPEAPEPFHLAAAITQGEENIELRWVVNGVPQTEVQIPVG